MPITKDIKDVVENNPLSLATVDKENKPNVIGVAFVKVVDNKTCIITDNYMTQTRQNILHNPHVCLAVWDADWKGYKLVGTAKYHTKGKWKIFIDNMKKNRGLPCNGAIVIKVSNVFKLC